MTTILRRIEPISLATVYAAIYGALALVLAVLTACVVMLIDSAAGTSEMGGVGLLAILLYPVMGVVAGFVGGWLMG